FGEKKSRRAARRKPAPKPKHRSEIDEEEKMLHAQIGALEGFIAGSPARDQRNKIKDPSVVPPPERVRGRGDHNLRMTPVARRPCYAKQERQSRQRDQHVMVFFLLFVGACWLAWWLLESSGG
ncbi:MAG: hypothetical protein AAGF67_10825, partial [Verrucomicrobiota bacterium]